MEKYPSMVFDVTIAQRGACGTGVVVDPGEKRGQRGSFPVRRFTHRLRPPSYYELLFSKLGDFDAARFHLEQGSAAVRALGDLYGQIVKPGLDGLASRLANRT